MKWLVKWKQSARKLKKKTMTLYLAFSDPRTPWFARFFSAVVLAYAFSPIDLIPDFIPILGYLDDLVLIPLGVFLAAKLIPAVVLAEAEKKAETLSIENVPEFKIMGLIVIIIWIILLILVARWGYALIRQNS